MEANEGNVRWDQQVGHTLELGEGADGQLLQGLVLETMGVLCQDSFMSELMGSFSRVQSTWLGLGLAETVWWGPGRGHPENEIPSFMRVSSDGQLLQSLCR